MGGIDVTRRDKQGSIYDGPAYPSHLYRSLSLWLQRTPSWTTAPPSIIAAFSIYFWYNALILFVLLSAQQLIFFELT